MKCIIQLFNKPDSLIWLIILFLSLYKQEDFYEILAFFFLQVIPEMKREDVKNIQAILLSKWFLKC
jgi:hypothetical protein